MLRDAGVPLTRAVSPEVDEEAIRSARPDLAPAHLALLLAEEKALAVSRQHPEALVLGADQILALEEGKRFDKPRDRDEARLHLRLMSGKRHILHCGVAMAVAGEVVWRCNDMATMTVRALSDKYIARYVEQHWDDIRHSVGCYRIEGAGAQLFEKVEGSQFTVIGLPLLPILAELRGRGVMAK